MVGKILNAGVDLLAGKFLETSTENAITRFKIGIGTTAPSISDTDLEIAIPISDGTVKLHVKSILRKLKIRSRVEAAVIAVEQGLGRKKITGTKLP